MMKLFKMCFCSIIWNIEDTSECTYKNISSSRDACNLEDVLYDLNDRFQCFLKKVSLCNNRLLAVYNREGRANSGTVYHH